jgi:hypothetical protein
MKAIKFDIQRESWDDMHQSGRYNRGLEVTFRDFLGTHTVKVGAGYSDDWYVYQELNATYFLSMNTGLGYVGLEIFEGDEKVWEMFLQTDYNLESVLGKKGLDLAPYNIIKAMLNYMV